MKSGIGVATARSDVPLSAAQIEGGAFFYTLALADRGSDLSVRFGE